MPRTCYRTTSILSIETLGCHSFCQGESEKKTARRSEFCSGRRPPYSSHFKRVTWPGHHVSYASFHCASWRSSCLPFKGAVAATYPPNHLKVTPAINTQSSSDRTITRPGKQRVLEAMEPTAAMPTNKARANRRAPVTWEEVHLSTYGNALFTLGATARHDVDRGLHACRMA